MLQPGKVVDLRPGLVLRAAIDADHVPALDVWRREAHANGRVAIDKRGAADSTGAPWRTE